MLRAQHLSNMYEILSKCGLFEGINPDILKNLLTDLRFRTKLYGKNDVIIMQGEQCVYIGIVLSGMCIGETYAPGGERETVNHFYPGDMFGDILALSEGRLSPVTVSAKTESSLLFVPFDYLFDELNDCKTRNKILKNLTKGVSIKYFDLQFRLGCICKPTLREKIMFYLYSFNKSGEIFEIPFSREDLASFLYTDRSALSRELSILKKENIIDYHKNTFRII